MSVVSVVRRQVEVSATVLSFVQASPTESGVCECGREGSIMRRHCHSSGCSAME